MTDTTDEKDDKDSLPELERMAEISSRSVLHEIGAERLRQIDCEGWTPEHDDEHTDGSLAQAAAKYALPNGLGYLAGWPASWDSSWWKPTCRRRDLIKAAALILAEIERLDRARARKEMNRD